MSLSIESYFYKIIDILSENNKVDDIYYFLPMWKKRALVVH